MSCFKPAPLKGKGDKSNWDFHLRLSVKEKERLEMMTKAGNYPTMAALVRDQIFNPDLRSLINLVLSKIDKLEVKIDGKK